MIKDKRLSEVLKIEDLKAFGRKVCIVSGVGSGKNYWVENELTKHGNVLLVTSRKLVKDQTLVREFFTKDAEFYGENYKVCTHSSIGKFVKENINPHQSINEVMFDYIVIDEAHALVSDATFSNDSNYLWQFIRNVHATVILMTATVSWIKEMIEDEGFKVMDMTNQCVNLRPTIVEVISQKHAKKILLEEASTFNKIIYMLPSANEAHLLEDEFIRLENRNDVVAITSKEREKNSNNELVQRQEETYEMIVRESRLPDDVNIILTTTKLREGVNIEDERIKICISGCHTSVDIKQFAGRFRTGIEKLYIVEDKRQNANYVSKFDIDASIKLLPKFNEVMKEFLNWGFGQEPSYYSNYSDCEEFYNLIEKKFELIKFNRYKNEFELYKQRIIGCEKEEEDRSYFISNLWSYLGGIFGEGIIISISNKESVKQAFKDKCKLFIKVYNNSHLNLEERNRLLENLTEIGLRNSKNQEYLNLGSAVSYLGYKLVYDGNKNNDVKILVEKQ